jgi:uncharacterized membrane protein YqiK
MTNILIIAGAAVVFVVLVITIITNLYKRATKETAFVRTGMGGEKVVLNGGALVLPVVHEIMRVGMTTTGLEVRRENEDSLITRDSMLVNVHAQFFVRVAPNAEAIGKAAQTLGKRTLVPSELKSFIESKFVDALRNVAASMTMDDLNQKRQEFVRAVQEACQHDLQSNGLELETVSLTSLNQTDKRYFNPDNAFHAEGLTQLTRRISERSKIRNDIETDTRVQIETKTLATDQQSYMLSQEREFSRLDQEKNVKNRSAVQAAEVAEIEAQRQADIAAANARGQQAAEQATIAAELETRNKRIVADQDTQTKTIQSEQAIKLAGQARDIAVANASGEQSKAAALADAARAEAVTAAQAVITAEAVAAAERQKEVQLVDATRVAEQAAIGVRTQAAAERDAALARADAVRAEAQGTADAEKLRAEGQRVVYEVEAAGKAAVVAAENTTAQNVMDFQNRQLMLKQLPEIIRESVKPLESIDSIKIVDVRGLGGNLAGEVHGGGEGSPVSMADSMTNAALRYRAQAPMLDSLLGELGMSGGSVQGLTGALAPAAQPNVTAEAAPAEPVADQPRNRGRRQPQELAD